MLTTGPGAITSVWMSMFRREHEKRERSIVILFRPDRSDPIGITIRQEILRVGISSICESFEQSNSLFDQLLLLLNHGVVRSRVFGDFGGSFAFGWEHGFGGIYHEDGEFEDEFGVVGLLCVLAVELERAIVGEELGFFAGSQMGCGGAE